MKQDKDTLYIYSMFLLIFIIFYLFFQFITTKQDLKTANLENELCHQHGIID